MESERLKTEITQRNDLHSRIDVETSVVEQVMISDMVAQVYYKYVYID